MQGYVEANAKAEVSTVLKSKTGWNEDEGIPQGTDEFGFCALPAGYRFNDGDFDDLGRYASFWTSTEFDDDDAYSRYLGCVKKKIAI